MKHAICLISYATQKKEATEKSETVNQILFGETVEVVKEKNNWLLVICNYDNYQGWVYKNQLTSLKELNDLKNKHILKTAQIKINSKTHGIQRLSLGAELYNYDNINKTAKILNEIYEIEEPNIENNDIKRTALSFLNTPYLWGGRSIYGIDCSAFVQLVYKVHNVKMPRDASQQAKIGKNIEFIENAKIGDLVFFDDEEMNIKHVGIIIGENQIIHASGKVRIDKIDHNGIYNEETEKYTHKLRIIKKIINNEPTPKTL